ncbi:hypothetical protein GT043_36445, partial [Streptomyces sp. SID2131]|nr:hypothetical protein [Streptomyces sp. SID2131]
MDVGTEMDAGTEASAGTEMDAGTEVVVVGGGAAGLSLAWRLLAPPDGAP